MSEQDDLIEGLMEFVTSVKTSMFYIARRLEALEASAMRQDFLFSVPELNDDERNALAKAQESA